MIGLQALNLVDALGEAHRHVEEHVSFVGGGARTRQIADVLGRRAAPVDDDVCGEEDTAERVEPPDVEEVADEREEDGEGVEDDVGEGVLGESLDRRVADQAAPQPTEAFDDDCRCHDGYNGDRQLDNRVVVA